jgi:sugar phosphate isomerase/epimerase
MNSNNPTEAIKQARLHWHQLPPHARERRTARHLDEVLKLLEEQMNAGGLEWTLCGGQSAGGLPQGSVWRLRPKDEGATAAQRTKDLQRLASAAKLLSELEEHFGETCTNPLNKRVRSWLSGSCSTPA